MKFKLLLGLLSLLFSNCYKPVSGCLEIEATNFQATADENCCCEYPKLKISVEQNFDSLVYIPDRKYQLENGEWIKIKAITFYLSDFQLIKNGETFEPTDTVHLKTFPNGVENVFKNDFSIVRRTPSVFSLGEFLPDGKFSTVNFRIGLTDAANKVKPTEASKTHPLFTQSEKMWENETEGYRFLRMEFARDTFSATLPDTIFWTKKDLPISPLTFAGDFNHQVGHDFELILKVDFAEWFAGVKLSDNDNLQLKSKIVSNLPSSFSVSQ